jgi:hypothetical protein
MGKTECCVTVVAKVRFRFFEAPGMPLSLIELRLYAHEAPKTIA